MEGTPIVVGICEVVIQTFLGIVITFECVQFFRFTIIEAILA